VGTTERRGVRVRATNDAGSSFISHMPLGVPTSREASWRSFSPVFLTEFPTEEQATVNRTTDAFC
jgi:hypothetical protein